jgi:hypothetical protein
LDDWGHNPIEVAVEAEQAERYAPTLNVIAIAFVDHLRRRARSGCPWGFPAHVDHSAGSEEDRWTRPDLACLAIGRGEFVTLWRADLHTVEAKTARGLNVTAFHEANAHSRPGQFTCLAFQAVGPTAPDTELFGEILSSASPVGVLTCARPGDPADWRVEQWPTRPNTDNAVADSFVRERFTTAIQDATRKLVDAYGWRDMRGPNDGL